MDVPLRVLAVGDPHFKGEMKNQSGNKLQTDEMRKAIIENVENLKPHIVVIMGDTLDRFASIHTIALCDSIEWIFALSAIPGENGKPIEIFVLIGNHDRPSQNDFLSDYHPFCGIRGTPNIHIVNKVVTFDCKGLGGKLVFVPYVPPGRFSEALNAGDVDLNEVIAVFAHQEFRGGKFNNIESQNGDVWSDNAPFVISGHIHNYQRLGKNILYVGTPMQHDFGDLEKKTISLLSFNAQGNSVTTTWPHPEEERLSLGLKERKILTFSVEETMNWSVESDLKYLLKLQIIDTSSAIRLFWETDKYHQLLEMGVTIAPPIVIKQDGTYTELSDVHLQQVNYERALINRVKDDPAQLQWLNKILGAL